MRAALISGSGSELALCSLHTQLRLGCTAPLAGSLEPELDSADVASTPPYRPSKTSCMRDVIVTVSDACWLTLPIPQSPARISLQLTAALSARLSSNHVAVYRRHWCWRSVSELDHRRCRRDVGRGDRGRGRHGRVVRVSPRESRKEGRQQRATRPCASATPLQSRICGRDPERAQQAQSDLFYH